MNKVTTLKGMEFSNADLFHDLSKHADANTVHLDIDENENEGQVNYILDVNGTGYNYANRKERDNDFQAIRMFLYSS